MIKILIIFPLIVSSLAALAQGDCSVLSIDSDKERYEILLDGEPTILFSEETLASLAKDYRASLDANEVLIKRCSSTIGNNDELLREYQQALDKIRQLSAQLLDLSNAHEALNDKFVASLAKQTALIEDYDALVKRYRRSALKSNAPFNSKLGLGVNNSDTGDNWDLFLGVEVFQFDAWLYGNSDQQGLGLGISF